MFRKLNICLIIAALLLASLRQFYQATADTQALPPGFAISDYAEGLGFATGMVILPNKDVMLLNKGIGENFLTPIRLVVNGVMQPEPVVSLYTNATGDSGLLALTIDPDFENNGWFYVYYATGASSFAYSGQTELRLSRFTFDHQTNKAVPNSEIFIMNGIPWAEVHHGNSLKFDSAGNLLMGLGDRAEQTQAQDISDPYIGKVLRIKPLSDGGYDIPADNPFVNDPNIPNEIYALGVRNPFRMATRDSDGTIVIGDVGSAYWEEVNILAPGLNYGWPEREGRCNAFRFEPCSPTPLGFTDPVVTYRHDENLAIGQNGAITGLDFYEGSEFPVEYQNKLFFTDFNQGFIAYADIDNPPEFEIFSTEFPVAGIVDIIAADGGLYLLNIYEGKIYFVYYTDSQNQVPNASFTSSAELMKPNQAITFDATNSFDPDGAKLTFNWDFGDGTTLSTNDKVTEYTYQTDGSYKVTLQVEDVQGAQSLIAEQTIYIYSGEIPEIELKISNDLARSKWHGGDAIEYTAVRSSLDGLDPTTPYKWQILLHHNEHVHPQIGDLEVISGTYNISKANHDGDWNLWYRFQLTMKTSTGQEIELSKEIFPQHTRLSVYTQPIDFDVEVNGGVQTTPHNFTAISGVNQQLVPLEEVFYGGDFGRFEHWLISPGWGGLRTPSVEITTTQSLSFSAPEEDMIYSVQYVYDRPGIRTYAPSILNGD
ncbi:MAG: PQQ-dependent sugar dehydrogenase [Chloroflexota bacterium]